MRPRLRVALLHLAPREMADFVATDLRILESFSDVRPLYYRGTFHGFFDAMRILRAVATTNVSVSWFAYRQAHMALLFARLLGKSTVVIVGGFDVAIEERPGNRIPPKDQRQLRHILNRADVVLPVSERLAGLVRAWTNRDDLKVVPLGFDVSRFRPGGPKDGSVLTVAYIRRDYLERKGIRPFVQAAREIPHRAFFVVGKPLDDSIEDLRREASANVTFTGWLRDDQLHDRFQAASVYVQASTHEGFGSSLAMAMLCECVPVVTERGAIPEVVGDTGIYVEPGNPVSIAEGIERASERPELGRRARMRIVENFSLERRRQSLMEAVRRSCPETVFP